MEKLLKMASECDTYLEFKQRFVDEYDTIRDESTAIYNSMNEAQRKHTNVGEIVWTKLGRNIRE